MASAVPRPTPDTTDDVAIHPTSDAVDLRRRIDDDQLRRDLLALPGPRNRLHAPEAMAATDELLLDAFRDAGWRTEWRPFELRDVWTSIDHGDFRAPQHHTRLRGANVVATSPGTDTSDAVVLVAHHDTVRDSPGADDNGSGVVALMAAARLLADRRHRRTVILAAVDMEEIGLVGSRQLARQLAAERRVVGAFVFESIGFATPVPHTQTLPPGFSLAYPRQVRALAAREHRAEFTAVIHRRDSRDTAHRVADALRQLEGQYAAIVVPEPTQLPVVGGALRLATPLVSQFARSDHMAFWELGLPAVWLTDTTEYRNPHYHRPGDLPDTIDCGRVAAVAAATAAAARELAGALT